MTENKRLICETRNRPYMCATSPDGEVVIFQPRCKMWSCKACAIINRDNWKYRVYESAQHLLSIGLELYFVTITSHESLDMKQSQWVWSKAWPKVRHRAAYHSTNPFAWLQIPEMHVDGRLHVHMIETSGLGTKWWKSKPRECGLGYMNEEKPVGDANGAVWYLTKYLNKGMGSAEHSFPRGFRRVRTAHKWPKKAQRQPEHNFQFRLLPKKQSLEEYVSRAKDHGDTVTICNHHQAWDIVLGNDDNSEET